MINLEKEYIDEIKIIKEKYLPFCEARVFGSRITNKYNKFSDLDIAIVCKSKIPTEKLNNIREAFEISDIPIIVDIIDFNDISENFKNIINSNYVKL